MTGNKRKGKGRGTPDAWWWRVWGVWGVWGLLPWAVGLGLTTSVGVSVLAGFVHTKDDVLDSGTRTEDMWGWATESSDLGKYDVPGLTLVQVSAAEPLSLTTRVEREPFRSGAALAWPWIDMLADRSAASISRWDASLFATGWPMRCLQGADFPDAWPEPKSVGLFKVGELGERVICYQPRWLALAVDTAFWGALWLGVLSVPVALRGKRRRARGMCPECGYDLKGELTRGCPECGWGKVDA